MEINLEEIAVKVKVTEQKVLKAIIGLNFGDFAIKGFRVMTSNFENSRGEKLWLVPPSYQDNGGKYHPIFYIHEKELWRLLEEKIWDEYYKQLEEYHRKQYGLKEEDL